MGSSQSYPIPASQTILSSARRNYLETEIAFLEHLEPGLRLNELTDLEAKLNAVCAQVKEYYSASVKAGAVKQRDALVRKVVRLQKLTRKYFERERLLAWNELMPRCLDWPCESFDYSRCFEELREVHRRTYWRSLSYFGSKWEIPIIRHLDFVNSFGFAMEHVDKTRIRCSGDNFERSLGGARVMLIRFFEAELRDTADRWQSVIAERLIEDINKLISMNRLAGGVTCLNLNSELPQEKGISGELISQFIYVTATPLVLVLDDVGLGFYRRGSCKDVAAALLEKFCSEVVYPWLKITNLSLDFNSGESLLYPSTNCPPFVTGCYDISRAVLPRTKG